MPSSPKSNPSALSPEATLNAPASHHWGLTTAHWFTSVVARWAPPFCWLVWGPCFSQEAPAESLCQARESSAWNPQVLPLHQPHWVRLSAFWRMWLWQNTDQHLGENPHILSDHLDWGHMDAASVNCCSFSKPTGSIHKPSAPTNDI